MGSLSSIMRYLAPYRALVAGTIAGLILAVGSELAIPRVIQGVIDGGIQPGDAGAILWGSLAIVGITMVDAVFTFLNTFVSNPTISGYSVVNPDADAGRFSNMTAILVVVFAFFGMFIFMVTRKLSSRQK